MAAPMQEIEITNIRNALVELWDKEQGQDKVRAALFNLILYLPKGQRDELFDSIVSNVVNKFPCRVLLIASDDQTQEDHLKTSVSAHTIGEGKNAIYCEIIRIDVGGKYRERIPFLITPNLEADLPVYLLWTEDPSLENPLFPELAKNATRIIFDAESTQDLQRYCKKLLHIEKEYQAEVGDLNWSALASWRKLLAEACHDSDLLKHLRETNLIEITYNKKESPLHPHTEIEASYLQAWIASRFGWKPSGKLCYHNGEASVKVKINSQKTDLPPGAILSLEIKSPLGGTLLCKRDSRSAKVDMHFSDQERCAMPTSHILSGVNEGDEILSEIFYPSSKEHLFSTISMLSQIEEK